MDKEEDDIHRILEWADTLELNRKIDVDKRWRNVERQIGRLRFRQKLIHYSRNAAAILMLPVLATVLYLYYIQQTDTAIPQVEMYIAYGQTSKIVLPDSSEVWLNSGSRLTYPQRFTGNHRQVALEGEGYFKVKADPDHRFDVRMSGGLIASAYGTEFNISSYKDDRDMEITLATGKLQIDLPDKKQACILQPEQQVVYSKDQKTLALQAANVYVETSWREGKIVFRRAGMQEVVSRLSRHFNVEFELRDKELYDYEYSATFTTESIGEILHLLEKSAPIRFQIIEPERADDWSYTKRKVIIERKK